jgi:hypothetical protein
VARMVNRRNLYRFVVGNHEGKRPLEITRRILLNWFLRNSVGNAWTGLFRHMIRTSGGLT